MKPILFSTAMVQAILDGRKTMTRRVIKIPYQHTKYCEKQDISIFSGAVGCKNCGCYHWDDAIKQKYQVGDVLWVRETWQYYCFGEKDSGFIYKASPELYHWKKESVIWKPSIFMPKEACRIFLRVTYVRVERLQDMETSDMLKEGVSEYKNYEEFRNNHDPRNAKDFVQARDKIVNDWITLWNSINGKGAWEANPYVFVYEFERVKDK